MRTCLAFAPWPLLVLACAAGAQTAPKTTKDLPTVTKPKPVPQPDLASDPAALSPELIPDNEKKPAPAPDADVVDPNAVPQPPPAKPEKGKSAKKAAPADDNATADQAGATGTTADYTGPSILSRGTNFTRPALPQNERFRPFAGISLFHDSGVTGAYQGPTAKVSEQGYTGALFSFGISGQHYRQKDSVQLEYHGNVYLQGYSSQDHAVSLGYSRILSRRITLAISETAGLSQNNFAVLNSTATTDTSVANTALVVTPNTEAFDNRTYYTSTGADMTYQKSSRLSFDIGSSFFYVRRGSNDLISANGYQARSDVAYRFSKRTTIGPYYAYSRYYYSKTFGDSDVHTVGLNYSYSISKQTQFRFRFGGSRLETRGLYVAALDPQVALILGTSTGIRRYYSVTYSPDFAIDITRTYRHSDVTFSYLQGISPGNGVVLTSRRNSESVSYNYNGVRRYGFSASGGRDGLSSVSQQIGSYNSYYGRLGATHTLPHSLNAVLTFDYRKLGFAGNTYSRNQYRISTGITYAPGAGPLRLW